MTAMTLLVNESVLNAAKHVFSKGLGSRFTLPKDESGRLHLNVSDDGPGMAQATETEAGSLGMGIMEALLHNLAARRRLAGAAAPSL
jgi:hypothetical protein